MICIKYLNPHQGTKLITSNVYKTLSLNSEKSGLSLNASILYKFYF